MAATFSRSPSGLLNILVSADIFPSIVSKPDNERSREIARLIRKGSTPGHAGWPMGYERALSKTSWGRSIGPNVDLIDPVDLQSDSYWRYRENRPHVEIASWFLRSINHRKIEVADLLVLSKLLGGSNVLRNHHVGTVDRDNGTRVVYIPWSQVESRLHGFVEELNSFNPAMSDFVYAATYFFLKLVSIHPFEDGNGRIAREMVTVVMFKKFGDIQPLYPIEPVLRWRRPNLHRGLHRWYLHQDISYLHSLFEAIIVANGQRCLKYKREGGVG